MKLSLLVFVVCFGISLSGTAQDEKRTYTITADGGVQDLAVYHEALAQCDLDPYRLITQERKLQFASGVEVVLLSAETLEQEFGRVRNRKTMNRKGDAATYPWLLELGPNGRIIDKRLTAVSAQYINPNASSSPSQVGE